MFYFNKQLSVGNNGEENFLKFYKDRNARKGDGRVVDLFIDKDKTVELKSDTYPSKNFFMERYGSNVTMKSGSVWRSLEESISFFVYYFIKEQTFYWFEPAPLAEFLDKYILKLQPRQIHNKGYYSIGYIVPVKDIEHLAISIDKF